MYIAHTRHKEAVLRHGSLAMHPVHILVFAKKCARDHCSFDSARMLLCIYKCKGATPAAAVEIPLLNIQFFA